MSPDRIPHKALQDITEGEARENHDSARLYKPRHLKKALIKHENSTV